MRTGAIIVIESCRDHARRRRTLEKNVRAAYSGTIAADMSRLADAHAAAANVYESLLAEYEAKAEEALP